MAKSKSSSNQKEQKKDASVQENNSALNQPKKRGRPIKVTEVEQPQPEVKQGNNKKPNSKPKQTITKQSTQKKNTSNKQPKVEEESQQLKPKPENWETESRLDHEAIRGYLRSYRLLFNILKTSNYYYIGETNLVMKNMKDGCPYIDLAVSREIFDTMNEDVKMKKDLMGRYVFLNLRLSVCEEMVKILDEENVNSNTAKFHKHSLSIEYTGQNLKNMRDAYKAMLEKITTNEASKYKDQIPYLNKEIKKFDDFVNSFDQLYPEGK